VSRRLVLLLVVVPTACSKTPTTAPCDERVREYTAWPLDEGKPNDLINLDELWAGHPPAELPVVTRGFRELDHAVAEIYLGANGRWGIGDPDSVEIDYAFDATTRADLVRKLSATGEPIAVLTEPGAPLAELAAVRRALGDRTVSLVVRLAPALSLARHRALVPTSPPWLDEVLERALATQESRSRIATELIPLLRPRLGRCEPELGRALEMLAGGGGQEVVGPAVAEGLGRCRCDGDVAALDSLLKFHFFTRWERPDVALLPLPAADDPRWIGQRVEELVPRLLGPQGP
jgi:hypothetical protein